MNTCALTKTGSGTFYFYKNKFKKHSVLHQSVLLFHTTVFLQNCTVIPHQL